ncbi:hypothetical protein JC525_15090 [Alteromonas sp. IB21]|uniref:hypothetical protein n=1 Tax=Alteromonas sp. IB21 TaxID=2779369 RepID=UPI0018E8B544|nr:hypothetical protein [Alteromonas sp. IB21]MBJ2130257.1 hypothetical protein [Alteromonas sp. IB21]
MKLKQYLSLNDATNYLSAALEEQVSVADIYELSLEGHIAISIRLTNQAYAKKVGSAPGRELIDGEHQVAPVLADEVDEQVHIFNGIYDLAMFGEERFEIRKLYQQAIQEDNPVLSELSGFYVKHEGSIYKLLESLPVSNSEESQISKEARLESLLKAKGLTSQSQFDDPLSAFENFDAEEILEISRLVSPFPGDEFREAISIPANTYQFVIRPTELHRLVAKLNNPLLIDGKVESKLLPLEKRTLLNVIHILLKELRIDPNVRGISSSISLLSDKAGIAISDNTIRKVLKDVVEYSD